jgi:hypothetical protein
VTVPTAGQRKVQCFRIMLKPFRKLFVRASQELTGFPTFSSAIYLPLE